MRKTWSSGGLKIRFLRCDCDGCKAELCADAMLFSDREFKMEAKHLGWTRKAGTDVCPEHSAMRMERDK